VLQAEGHRQDADHDQLGVVVVVQRAGAGQDRKRHQQHDFRCQHRGDPRSGSITEKAEQPAAEDGGAHEGG
jgi:hypothetical protein